MSLLKPLKLVFSEASNKLSRLKTYVQNQRIKDNEPVGSGRFSSSKGPGPSLATKPSIESFFQNRNENGLIEFHLEIVDAVNPETGDMQKMVRVSVLDGVSVPKSGDRQTWMLSEVELNPENFYAAVEQVMQFEAAINFKTHRPGNRFPVRMRQDPDSDEVRQGIVRLVRKFGSSKIKDNHISGLYEQLFLKGEVASRKAYINATGEDWGARHAERTHVNTKIREPYCQSLASGRTPVVPLPMV